MWKKFIFCTDTHGKEIDPLWSKKFLRFVEDYNPHYRIHGGDFTDAKPLRNGADVEERAEGVWDDVKAASRFLEKYRPHYLLKGNHDDRYWRLANRVIGGIDKEHASDVVRHLEKKFKKLNIKTFEDDARNGVLSLHGKLKFTHGIKSGANCAREMAKIYDHIIFGHVHAFCYSKTEGHPDPKFGMSVGCGCDTDPSYAKRWPSKLKWEQGWAFGQENTKTGDYEVWSVVRKGSQFVTPMGVL